MVALTWPRIPDPPHRRDRLQGTRRAPPRRPCRRPGWQPLPHPRPVSAQAGRERRPRHRAAACPGAQGRPPDPRRRPVPPRRQATARRVGRRQAGAPVRLP
jgi:hypothetical protein